MALGASRRDAVAIILRGAFGLIVMGLVLGLPLTFAAGRFLGNQLYGMNPYDPFVVLTAVGGVGVIGVLGLVNSGAQGEPHFARWRLCARSEALARTVVM